MSTLYVIALLGKEGSGKSTAAKWFQKTYGALIFSFATQLKLMAMELYELAEHQVFGTQEEKNAIDPRYGASGRDLMQRLGAAARKRLGEDVWVNATYNAIRAKAQEVWTKFEANPLFVIDDMRHVNEFEAVTRWQIDRGHPQSYTATIKLVCPDAPPPKNPSHPSEAQVDLISPYCQIVSHRTEGSSDLIAHLERVVEHHDGLVPSAADAQLWRHLIAVRRGLAYAKSLQEGSP